MTATAVERRAGVRASLRGMPRPVLYLLSGVMVNQLGAYVQTFLLLYLAVRGFSTGQAGVALTVYSAGTVCGTLLGAELTQRLGPRTTITAAMTVSAVSVASVPALSVPRLYPVLLIVTAMAGLATQAYRPAAAVLLSDLAPEGQRVMAFSMMRIALNAGAAGTPLLAAALIVVDWNLLYWIDGGTALAYAILALTLLPRTEAPREEPSGRRTAYRVLLRDGRYLLFLGSVLLGTLVYIQYTVALPLKLRAEHQPVWLYSAALTTSSVILVCCELKVTSYVRHWRPHLAVCSGTVLVGLGMAGYGLVAGSVSLVIASTVVFVVGVMISGPTMFAYPASFPDAVRTRYVGAHQAVFGLGMAIGPAVGVLGWLRLGGGVWYACGLVNLVSAGCAWVAMRRPVRG